MFYFPSKALPPNSSQAYLRTTAMLRAERTNIGTVTIGTLTTPIISFRNPPCQQSDWEREAHWYGMCSTSICQQEKEHGSTSQAFPREAFAIQSRSCKAVPAQHEPTRYGLDLVSKNGEAFSHREAEIARMPKTAVSASQPRACPPPAPTPAGQQGEGFSQTGNSSPLTMALRVGHRWNRNLAALP